MSSPRRPRNAASVRRPARDRERGQAIVVVALSMVFMAGFLALVLDVGFAYAQRRMMQNAADAASQAATRLIALDSACSGTGCPPYGDADIKGAIDQYVGANHGSLDYATDPPEYVDAGGTALGSVGGGTLPTNTAGVVVTTTVAFPSFFAAVLGQSRISVQSQGSSIMAGSQMQSIPAEKGLVPVVVPLLDYQTAGSSLYDLWGPHYGQTYGVGSQYKGLVDFSGASGPQYAPSPDCNADDKTCVGQWAANGFDGVIGVGDSAPLISGDKSGWVTDGFIQYCQSQGTSDDGGAYGLFKLAIYDSFSGSAVHISGFAEFKVYCGDIGNSMPGRFVSYVSPGASVDPGANLSVPGPRTVQFVPPFSGISTGGQAVPTDTPVSAPPIPTATGTPAGGTPTSTPTALVPTDTPTVTATPAAATPTATVAAATATPTGTPTSTSHSYWVLGWQATYANGGITYSSTSFACDAGTASVGPISWSSQGSPHVYFVVWPTAAAPTYSQVMSQGSSNASFSQTLAAPDTYTVYAYNDGHSRKDATVGSFTVTCQ